MKLILIKDTPLTGGIAEAGKEIDCTPEFGKQLLDEGYAKEPGIINRVVEKIEKAVHKPGKEEATTKHKDN